jgi:hypothetical protein
MKEGCRLGEKRRYSTLPERVLISKRTCHRSVRLIPTFRTNPGLKKIPAASSSRFKVSCGEANGFRPAKNSPITRGDKAQSTVSFTTDADGKQLAAGKLVNSGRWLWFDPKVVSELISWRGGDLRWYTRDTGQIACSPDYTVHFGINSIGLINAYAKDVALLPEWQQKVWAGFNVRPDGKVSAELYAAQAGGQPADTQAPEDYIEEGLNLLARAAQDRLGISILRPHRDFEAVIRNCHRFRAIAPNGLFALAKDLARVSADSFSAAEIQKVIQPQNEKWGPLKSLEKMIGLKLGEDRARTFLSPLFGVYELRLADAHLPSKNLNETFRKVNVDSGAHPIFQGVQLLDSFVSVIHSLAAAIDKAWKS